MKDDLLNLLTTWSAIAQILTWTWIAAPWLLYGAGLSLAVLIVRRVYRNFTRANALIREIELELNQPWKETQ